MRKSEATKIVDELYKELREAYSEAKFAIKVLEIFLDFFPEPCNPATHPPIVVAEEARVIKEFYRTRDRYFLAYKQFSHAYKMEQQLAYYEEIEKGQAGSANE
jgi:hypothetical protein